MTLILTRAQVEAVATMPMALEAVERAFDAHGRGEAQMPPKVYLDLPEHEGDFRAMPSAMSTGETAYAGVKWVNSHPRNPERHALPSVMGVYVLSDPATALPLAIMDATLLTALRTGAAAGVASKHLFEGTPARVGLVGSGVQARFLVEAHRALYGDAFEALFADREHARAEQLARTLGGRAVSLQEASGADIVCTSTPSRTPVVERAWLREGAHINAMGADGPGKQELDPAILDAAQVVIDEAHQAEHSGEINVPIHQGRYALSSVAATLGEVVSGRARIERSRLTLFDSTGLAIQDVSLAAALYAAARAAGVGTELDLVGAAPRSPSP